MPHAAVGRGAWGLPSLPLPLVDGVWLAAAPATAAGAGAGADVGAGGVAAPFGQAWMGCPAGCEAGRAWPLAVAAAAAGGTPSHSDNVTITVRHGTRVRYVTGQGYGIIRDTVTVRDKVTVW